MNIDANEMFRLIEVAISALDQEWLSKEVKRINSLQPKPSPNFKILKIIDYERQFHPLAYMVYKFRKTCEYSLQNNQPLKVTEEMHRLCFLGYWIEILKEKKVKGMEEKIRALASNNHKAYEKTLFEIQVAAAYTRNGHLVEFVDTQEGRIGKTPDLLVDNSVEIECKKKDTKSPRDAKNRELWKRINEQADRSMDKHGYNYAVLIKTQEDLTQQDIEFVNGELETIIGNKSQGDFGYENHGICITATFLSRKDEEIITDRIERAINEEFDYLMPTGNMMKRADGKHVIKNHREFAYRCANPPDRVKSVIGSVNDAIKQFSGGKPALAYVNMNTIQNTLSEGDFKRLESMITEVLINNSKLNAVVLTAEVFPTQKENSYEHRSRVIRNTTPKNSLSQDFLIIGETK